MIKNYWNSRTQISPVKSRNNWWIARNIPIVIGTININIPRPEVESININIPTLKVNAILILILMGSNIKGNVNTNINIPNSKILEVIANNIS